MPSFPKALQAWPSEGFAQALVSEIKGLDTGILPLHEGTTQGGFIDDSHLGAILMSSADDGDAIQAQLGVYFTEILAGCSCGDEPEEINTYCRLAIRIDKATAQAEIRVVAE